MASKYYVVPRLENRAFEVSFQNVIENLLLCRSHRPENKELHYWNYPSLISLNPFLTSKNIIKLIRDSLDHHLVGLMNDETRKKFVEKFYHLPKHSTRLVDVWVFLDCVLDESFQELTTPIAFPGCEPNPKLITTIAERASYLEKLQISFFMMKKTSTEALIPVFLSLAGLNCLTSLSLFMLPESHKSVLKYLGSCCPLLSDLYVTGLTIEKRDILAIVLGELIDDLLPNDSKEAAWSYDTVLKGLVVPPKFLSSLCVSLKRLFFTDIDPKNEWSVYSEPYDPIGFSDSTLAFALRHLSSLEEFDGTAIKSKAIIILHRSGGTSKLIQSKFSQDCLEAFSRRVASSVEPINLEQKSFFGSLQLTDIGIISVLHEKALRSVGVMCPYVKNAVFCEESVHRLRPSNQPYRFRMRYNGEMSAENLEEILKGWPKLESVNITGVSPSLVKSILSVFGPDLKHLTFESCKEINLQDLVPCLQLESLCILTKSTLDLGESEPLLEPESFLPKLKSFESDICLGSSSRLFEEKSDLTHVVLNCYHIGVKDGVVSHPDWSKLPKVWTRLETLHIRQCPALTTDMVVSSFVPQLIKLKEICLPDGEEEEEVERQNAIDQLATRASPVILRFEEKKTQKCPLIQSKPAGCRFCGGKFCANDSSSDNNEEASDEDSGEETSDEDSDEESSDADSFLHFMIGHSMDQGGAHDGSDESDQDDGDDSDTNSDTPPDSP